MEALKENLVLTPEEFAEQMRRLVKVYGHDEEMFHIEADGLMAALLIALGYEKGVKEFIKQPKWYS